jgi:hypothetical protein
LLGLRAQKRHVAPLSSREAAKRMIEHSMEHFDLYPARLLGDSAYGSAEMLGWLVYQQSGVHVTIAGAHALEPGLLHL